MATNKKVDPKRSGAKRSAWYGFINCEIDAAAKVRYTAWASDQGPNDAWEWMVENLGTFKFSFSYSDAQSCVTASMTGTSEEDTAYTGLTLSARAKTVEKALLTLMFKHEVLLQQSWNDRRIAGSKDDDWIG